MGVTLQQRLLAQIAAPERQAVAIQLAGAGVAFLVYAFIARAYGASVSGEYSIFLQTVIVAGAVAVFGRDEAVTRAIARSLSVGKPGQARAEAWLLGGKCALWVSVAALATWVAHPWIERLGAGEIASYAIPLAVVLLGLHRFLTACVRGSLHIRTAQLLMIVPALVMLLLLGLAYASSASQVPELSLLYGQAIGVAALLALFAFWRISKGWPRGQGAKPDPATRSNALGFSVLIAAIFNWGIFAVLGYAAGSASVGVYQICFQLQLPLAIAAGTYTQAAGPRVSGLFARNDRATAWSEFRTQRRFLVLAALVPIAFIAIFAPQILAWFGEAFVEGVLTLRLLMLAMALRMVAGTATAMLVMDNGDSAYLMLTIIGVVAAALACLVLVDRIGMAAGAVAILVQSVTLHFGAYAIAARKEALRLRSAEA